MLPTRWFARWVPPWELLPPSASSRQIKRYNRAVLLTLDGVKSCYKWLKPTFITLNLCLCLCIAITHRLYLINLNSATMKLSKFTRLIKLWNCCMYSTLPLHWNDIKLFSWIVIFNISHWMYRTEGYVLSVCAAGLCRLLCTMLLGFEWTTSCCHLHSEFCLQCAIYSKMFQESTDCT